MAGCLDGVLVHRDVLGTADHEVVDVAQAYRLVDSLLARPGGVVPFQLGHPDAPAPGPAAERVVAAPGHLGELCADRGEHVPRLFVDAVVAPERTRVVVRDAIAERL